MGKRTKEPPENKGETSDIVNIVTKSKLRRRLWVKLREPPKSRRKKHGGEK